MEKFIIIKTVNNYAVCVIDIVDFRLISRSRQKIIIENKVKKPRRGGVWELDPDPIAGGEGIGTRLFTSPRETVQSVGGCWPG